MMLDRSTVKICGSTRIVSIYLHKEFYIRLVQCESVGPLRDGRGRDQKLLLTPPDAHTYIASVFTR